MIMFFCQIGVNVNGEYGATPLHYAARYVSKPSKIPLPTPLDTPQPSPSTRKVNKGLKNLISNRRISVVRNLEAPRGKGGFKSSPFIQRSWRNLLGKTGVNNKKQCEIPLVTRLDKNHQAIHKSLDRMAKTNLLVPETQERSYDRSADDQEFAQTQSNMELQSLFKQIEGSPANEGDETPNFVIAGEESDSKSPTATATTTTSKNMDALITPVTKNDNGLPSLKASKSLSDIADDVTNPDLTESRKRNSSMNNVGGVVHMLDVPAPRPKEESILMYLLEQKANVNARDYYGSTPLHFASMRGNVVAARRLLEIKSIDIEVRRNLISLSRKWKISF